MNRIKIGFIFFLLINQFCAFAQNWTSVGGGFISSAMSVRYFHVDTATNVLLCSAHLGATQRFLKYDGLNAWDTLGNNIGAVPFQITSYRGEYYAVNYFSPSGQYSAVAKLVNNTWQPFARTRNIAYALYQHDTSLYAMGTFDSIGGIAANGIARYDGQNWHSIDSVSPGNSGATCAIVYQGKLYKGGNFHDSNGSCGLTWWDGQQWQGFGNSFCGGWDAVNCLVEYNGELYVGGYFTTSTGSPGNFIARWNGTAWTQVGGGLWSGQVYDMKVFNGELWVCGQFVMAGGISTPYLAKYDGTDWCNVGNFDGIVGAIEVFNNELYVGGGFWTVDGDSVEAVIKWIGGNNTGACGHLNTGIEVQMTNNITVNVFPNPVTTNATFQITGADGNKTLIIYDQLGKEIWRKETDENRIEFIVEGFSSGLYFYHLQEKGELKTTGKFIIR